MTVDDGNATLQAQVSGGRKHCLTGFRANKLPTVLVDIRGDRARGMAISHCTVKSF